MKVNAMRYYSLNGKSVISFPENSRWESIINFIRKVRKNNLNKAIIIVVDNLKSHKVISTTFVRHMDDMRTTIKEAFYRLT
jgi:hypothetical protein